MLICLLCVQLRREYAEQLEVFLSNIPEGERAHLRKEYAVKNVSEKKPKPVMKKPSGLRYRSGVAERKVKEKKPPRPPKPPKPPKEVKLKPPKPVRFWGAFSVVTVVCLL